MSIRTTLHTLLAALAMASAPLAVVTACVADGAGSPSVSASHRSATPTVQSGIAGLPEVIREDDPRWDCRVMGNRVCGPVAALGWKCDIDPEGKVGTLCDTGDVNPTPIPGDEWACSKPYAQGLPPGVTMSCTKPVEQN